MTDTSLRLLPASQFTIDDLTNLYNQTRVDYMVPMPMDVAHLAAYIRVYDIDLLHSWLVLDGEQTLGLAMLGVRWGRAWVTRLGVLPASRHRGTGEMLLLALLKSTRLLGCRRSILEVIKGNMPAYNLFSKVGYAGTRELVVLRRSPGKLALEPEGLASWLDQEDALDLLRAYPDRLAWTNEPESYINAGDAQALVVDMPAAGQEGPARGWLVFRRQPLRLSHFVLYTEHGNPLRVASALLAHLYQRYSQRETYIENLSVTDPHLPVLMKTGFLEVFRRIEMVREE